MTITVNSSSSILIVFAVIFAAVILTMLLKRGQLRQKIISLVMMIAVFGLVYFSIGKPGTIEVNNTGIHSDLYGKIDFDWSEVQSAEIVENYKSTGWNPSVKINGSSFPEFKAGRFRLKNGEMAKILTQKSDDAVVFRTGDGIYLLAIDEQEKLIDIASEYITF